MIKPENMLDYIDRITPQWIAGIFDGEGCVSSSLDSYGNVKLRVEIAQSNIHILQLICIKVSGTIMSAKQRNKSGTSTTIHRIRWNDGDCKKILAFLKDNVVVKHALVENGLKLANLFQACGGNGHYVTEDLKNEKATLRNNILAINEGNRAKMAV
jgi:hypothetical protein